MDNFFKSCPPKMSDGRAFGDFKTATRRNEQIKYIKGVQRDDEYRLMLQNEASDIMNKMWAFHKKDQHVPKACVHQSPTRVTLREQAETMSLYNKAQSVLLQSLLFALF